MYALHSSVGAQLPINQLHIRFVFAIASYPNTIMMLQVLRLGEMAIDERLADIKYRPGSPGRMDMAQPLTNIFKQSFNAACFCNLPVRRFHIQHRWQVACLVMRMLQEVLCLRQGGGGCRIKMIRSHSESVLSGLLVVGGIKNIPQRLPFRTLDIDERNRVVDLPRYLFLAERAQMYNPQGRPIDGVVLFFDDMLIL